MLILLLSLAGPVFAPAPVSADSGQPAADEFYTPPSPLPANLPGDVIRWRTASSPVPGVAVWQLLYRSTTARGEATAVSGTVLVPQLPYAGVRPLVAYAPGTQGWGDQCAPSRAIPSGQFNEELLMALLLVRGYAVVVPDYPGLGTPGEEAYNVGLAEGQAVLDALRAATRLTPAKLDPGAPLGIWGYSQGGGAAAWAGELAGSYAPELPLRGIAAGGVPADLKAVANTINGTLFFPFLAGTAIGLDAAYPSLDLAGQLTPSGRQALRALAGICQFEAMAAYGGHRIEEYTVGRVNPIDTPPWRAAIDANKLGSRRPAGPILLYHARLDEAIPWAVVAQLQRQYCAAGVTVELRGYIGGHITGIAVGANDAVGWLADRFAGVPAKGNC